MRALLATLMLLAAAQPAAAADKPPQPSMLKSLGDCVTPRISATVKGESVDFFTDRCGEQEGVFYISLNGTDHTLKRVSRTPGDVPYTGTFQGERIFVEVTPGKLLRREWSRPEDGEPVEIVSEEYAVTVTVTEAGKAQHAIEGVFWQGR